MQARTERYRPVRYRSRFAEECSKFRSRPKYSFPRHLYPGTRIPTAVRVAANKDWSQQPGSPHHDSVHHRSGPPGHWDIGPIELQAQNTQLVLDGHSTESMDPNGDLRSTLDCWSPYSCPARKSPIASPRSS